MYPFGRQHVAPRSILLGMDDTGSENNDECHQKGEGGDPDGFHVFVCWVGADRDAIKESQREAFPSCI
jgi:hypothetical protein